MKFLVLLITFTFSVFDKSEAQVQKNFTSSESRQLIDNYAKSVEELGKMKNTDPRATEAAKKICESVKALEEGMKQVPGKSWTALYYSISLDSYMKKLGKRSVLSREGNFKRKMQLYYGKDYRKYVPQELKLLENEKKIAKKRSAINKVSDPDYSPLTDLQANALASFHEFKILCRNKLSFNPEAVKKVRNAAGWVLNMDEALEVPKQKETIESRPKDGGQ